MSKPASYIPMVGKRFGKLEVIRESHQDRFGNYHYDCRCDCGNIRNGHGCEIRGGRITACHQCQAEDRKIAKQLDFVKQEEELKAIESVVRLEEILSSLQENEQELKDVISFMRQEISERR